MSISESMKELDNYEFAKIFLKIAAHISANDKIIEFLNHSTKEAVIDRAKNFYLELCNEIDFKKEPVN